MVVSLHQLPLNWSRQRIIKYRSRSEVGNCCSDILMGIYKFLNLLSLSMRSFMTHGCLGILQTDQEYRRITWLSNELVAVAKLWRIQPQHFVSYCGFHIILILFCSFLTIIRNSALICSITNLPPPQHLLSRYSASRRQLESSSMFPRFSFLPWSQRCKTNHASPRRFSLLCVPFRSQRPPIGRENLLCNAHA